MAEKKPDIQELARQGKFIIAEKIMVARHNLYIIYHYNNWIS